MELVNNLGYKKIRFIGKSLGGIVASKFLNNLDQKDQEKYSIIVFGYAMPYINFDNFYGNIVVVHGDNDSHGSVDNVEKSLASSPSQEKQVIAIADADHSFNKEDLKENEAIDAGY
ncbi:MAG: hypothetical protein HC932_03895 [Thermales bacterium]|nr:hypothetical protein [Thermales bacterium]